MTTIQLASLPFPLLGERRELRESVCFFAIWSQIRVSFRGGEGGAKGGVCPPWVSSAPPPPPLDYNFILPHSLVVDAAPP